MEFARLTAAGGVGRDGLVFGLQPGIFLGSKSHNLPTCFPAEVCTRRVPGRVPMPARSIPR